MRFEESGLSFRFNPRQWAVRRYDTHTYFQGLSGAGLRGVDFVGLWRSRLVLIEVKNYSDARATLPTEADLADILAAKYADTLRGLDAIERMLHRKVLFRLWRPALLRWGAARLDWAFWAQAGRLARQPSHRVALAYIVGPDGLAHPAWPQDLPPFRDLLLAEDVPAYFARTLLVEAASPID